MSNDTAEIVTETETLRFQVKALIDLHDKTCRLLDKFVDMWEKAESRSEKMAAKTLDLVDKIEILTIQNEALKAKS